jgi:hypothetical protein
LLVCGRRGGPVGTEDVQACWGDAGPWPALPTSSVLRLRPSGVVLEQKGRDVGEPTDRPDPEGEVRRLMEALRLRLRDRVEFFEGLAFSHAE